MTTSESINRLRQMQAEIAQIERELENHFAKNRLQIARLDLNEAIKHLDKEMEQNAVERFTYNKRATRL